MLLKGRPLEASWLAMMETLTGIHSALLLRSISPVDIVGRYLWKTYEKWKAAAFRQFRRDVLFSSSGLIRNSEKISIKAKGLLEVQRLYWA